MRQLFTGLPCSGQRAQVKRRPRPLEPVARLRSDSDEEARLAIKKEGEAHCLAKVVNDGQFPHDADDIVNHAVNHAPAVHQLRHQEASRAGHAGVGWAKRVELLLGGHEAGTEPLALGISLAAGLREALRVRLTELSVNASDVAPLCLLTAPLLLETLLGRLQLPQQLIALRIRGESKRQQLRLASLARRDRVGLVGFELDGMGEEVFEDEV
mmetsp:Transcript_48007/g.159976  ORF Transcript_48007/g.159976 Transcript_48007/m.159976 type:complete len:212 (-) Transcript_48007:4048-4683(-)